MTSKTNKAMVLKFIPILICLIVQFALVDISTMSDLYIFLMQLLFL